MSRFDKGGGGIMNMEKFINEKKAVIEDTFGRLVEMVEQKKKEIAEIIDEQKKLQGEYRLLEEMSKQTVAEEEFLFEGKDSDEV